MIHYSADDYNRAKPRRAATSRSTFDHRFAAICIALLLAMALGMTQVGCRHGGPVCAPPTPHYADVPSNGGGCR